MTKENIARLIAEEIAKTLEIDAAEVSPDEDFMEMGLTSLEAIKLVNTIRDSFNIPEIGPAVIFEYHTIAQLSEHLSGLIIGIAP